MSFSRGNSRLMPHIGWLLMIGNGLEAARHILKLFKFLNFVVTAFLLLSKLKLILITVARL